MLRLLWIVGCCACVVGCPQPKLIESVSKPALSEAERPPLRILVLGDCPWTEVISRRWQSVSEQRLDVQTISFEKIDGAAPPKSDVLIFESRWLPTLVERGWVSPLPKQVCELPVDMPEMSRRPNEWPLVWRQSATYGQRLWGIPLGVPMMVIVEHPDRSSTRPLNWKERIEVSKTTSEVVPTVASSSDAITDTFLLDRFLVIAASMNPIADDSGFLFNMNTAQARLNEAWIVDAAQLFGQLYFKSPALANMNPESAWESVASKKFDWALAWPTSKGEPSLVVQKTEPWLDSGRGLVAASASTNRQSASTNRFLSWLNADNQRQELAVVSPAIQPLPDRWASASEQTDINQYRKMLKQAFDDRYVVRELRFAESNAYRQRLIQALQLILANPADAEVELKRCASDWDQITAKIGRDVQRRRLARSFELEAK